MSSPPKKKKRKFFKFYREIKKLPGWIYIFPAMLIRLTRAMTRFRLVDPTGAIDIAKLPYVCVSWHNRLLLFPTVFKRKYRELTYALVSPSRDGQYLADLLCQFGVNSVRGSTNKRSGAALREAMALLENGKSLSLTPDGPRGPRYHMSLGPVILASKTGKPILPVAINASKYWELKSWDRFQIPKPGARVECVVGTPIHVPPDLDDQGLEQWRKTAEDALMAISRPNAED